MLAVMLFAVGLPSITDWYWAIVSDYFDGVLSSVFQALPQDYLRVENRYELSSMALVCRPNTTHTRDQSKQKSPHSGKDNVKDLAQPGMNHSTAQILITDPAVSLSATIHPSSSYGI